MKKGRPIGAALFLCLVRYDLVDSKRMFRNLFERRIFCRVAKCWNVLNQSY